MTTRSDEQTILDRADDAVEALEKSWPTLSYLATIREQIAYLRAVGSGAEQDRSRLSAINIAVLAAKDVEDRDTRAAKALHRVADLARRMAAERA